MHYDANFREIVSGLEFQVLNKLNVRQQCSIGRFLCKWERKKEKNLHISDKLTTFANLI